METLQRFGSISNSPLQIPLQFSSKGTSMLTDPLLSSTVLLVLHETMCIYYRSLDHKENGSNTEMLFCPLAVTFPQYLLIFLMLWKMLMLGKLAPAI